MQGTVGFVKITGKLRIPCFHFSNEAPLASIVAGQVKAIQEHVAGQVKAIQEGIADLLAQ
jgi:hypothetical protein